MKKNYLDLIILIGFTCFFNFGKAQNLQTTKSFSNIGTSNIDASNPLKPDYSADIINNWEKPFNSFQFNVYRKGEHQLPYRLHQPKIMKKGRKYPLVLFMHGAGERGLDNRGQFFRFSCLKFWEKYPCYVLAPQCPLKQDNIPNSELKWVDTRFSSTSQTMKENPTWPMELTLELLDNIIKENKIDCNRIYVTGLSMGGFATWELIQRKLNKFAAAIPISGGGDPAYAFKLTDLPLWVFHGDADKTVPIECSYNMIKAIKEAGGHPIYTVYPNIGHDCWGLTYNNPEVWDWLIEQSKK